ncbi:MAG: Flp pilus assembly protein TadD [Cryomorphaceae bacterium]|jgi:Flp pilus assembly protein TadD
MKKPTVKSIRLVLGYSIISLSLMACSSLDKSAKLPDQEPAWIIETLDYKNTLSAQHPDGIESILQISAEMGSLVRSKFDGYSRAVAAIELAEWLIDENGHNMQYNVNANYSPIQAFNNKQGNCLSFTLLLSAMAAELDVNIEFNEVDLPDVWEFDEDSGMVLYRHINGVRRAGGNKQIFDLAIENYDFGFPQRIVSRERALAKLHSNRAIAYLATGKIEPARHYIKLAISLAPSSSDLWINLGVLYKREDQFDRAEVAFLRAHTLDLKNALAASNLERLYQSQGRAREAKKYQKLALRARRYNPYYHFSMAKTQYQEESFRSAKKSIRRAIKLHDNDARFYELSSRIAQRQKRFVAALLDLEKASTVTQDAGERGRYASKFRRVLKMVESQELQRQKLRVPGAAIRVSGNG